jgi:hypothetical protein
MYNRGGEFLKRAIVVFIGQVSFPQQAVKQSIDNAGAMTETISFHSDERQAKGSLAKKNRRRER